MKRTFPIIVSILSFFSAEGAQAYDWEVTGVHVTAVSVLSFPNSVSFQIDSAAGNCHEGDWVSWYPSNDFIGDRLKNVEGIYSMLLAARLSNRPMNLSGRNGNLFADCTVEFGYLG